MSGEEIARELINVISAQYGIGSHQLIAAMHDRAACNGVALRTIKVVYSSIVDIGCLLAVNLLHLVSLPLWSGGLVSSVTVQRPCCCGRRELVCPTRDTRQPDGGASTR